MEMLNNSIARLSQEYGLWHRKNLADIVLFQQMPKLEQSRRIRNLSCRKLMPMNVLMA
jgi:hypothetical protein